MSLKAHLEHIELAQYLEVFESQDVDLEMLRALNEADLKEIGIESFGHRRKIVASFAEAQPHEPVSPAVKAQAQAQAQAEEPAPGSPTVKTTATHTTEEEHVFLETTIAVIGEHDSMESVSITNRRAVLGPKTYALQNIASVQLQDNQDEIDFYNHTVDVQKKNCTALAIFLAACSVVPLATEADGFWVGCCIGLAVIALFIAEYPDKRDDVFYTVRIDAAGTSTDVLATYDQKKAKEICTALNEAIVSLKM